MDSILSVVLMHHEHSYTFFDKSLWKRFQRVYDEELILRVAASGRFLL